MMTNRRLRSLRLALGAAALALAGALPAGPVLAAPFDNPGFDPAFNPGFNNNSNNTTLPQPGTGLTPVNQTPAATPATPAPAPTPNVAAQAAAAQRAAQHQAALAAVRAANEQRRAARAAAQQRAAQTVWQRTGRPTRLIVIRPRTVDIMSGGALSSRIQRGGGPLGISQLASYAPSSWISSSGGITLLGATVALTAGTTLNSSGATIRLAGGPSPASAAAIWVGRGTLNLSNVTVTSWDPTKQAAMPPSPGRPFIVVGSGGQLRASNATLTDLGAASSPPASPAPSATPSASGKPSASATPASGPSESGDQTGVVFGAGSSGSLAGAKLQRNVVGLKLSGSTNVHLNGVEVTDASGDGLVLHNDHGTTFTAVDATDNGRNGVMVSGTGGSRALSGVTTSGNAAFGVAAIRQSQLRINGVSTTSDHAGGLRLTGCNGCTIARTTNNDEPIGILANGGSSQLTLDHPQVHGGARGLVLNHGVSDVNVQGLAVDHATSVGAAVAAARVQLQGITVSDSATAVKLSGAASQVTLAGPSVARGNEGIAIARGARNVSLKDLQAENVGRDAVVSDAAGTAISGGRIAGGRTGINARAATTIDGTSISGAIEGVHAAAPATVQANHIDVVTITTGIKMDPNTQFVLVDSRVQAHDAIRGRPTLEGNDNISMPPLWWLGGVGVLLIVIAILLELTQTLRQRLAGVASQRSLAPARLTIPLAQVRAAVFARRGPDSALSRSSAAGWPAGSNGRGVNPTVFPVMDQIRRQPDGS